MSQIGDSFRVPHLKGAERDPITMPPLSVGPFEVRTPDIMVVFQLSAIKAEYNKI